MNNPLLQAALEYAANDYAVFPIHKSTKEPATKHGFLDASTDEETIFKWWSDNPGYNVGIATGVNLTVLDIDPPKWGDQSLNLLQEYLKGIPQTSYALTGGGGKHLLFKTATPIKNDVGLLPGIDLRGKGGYIVAPPSLHATGMLYQFPPGFSPLEMEPTMIPAKLLETIEQLRPFKIGKSIDFETVIREGVRNDSLFRLSARFRNRKMPDEILRMVITLVNTNLCKPPLGKAEVERIIDSSRRYQNTDGAGPARSNGVVSIDLANQFLLDSALLETDIVGLRYYRDAFYEYRSGHYREIREKEVQARIIKFLINKTADQKPESKVRPVLEILKGLGLVEGNYKLPLILDAEGNPKEKPALISLTNGTLDLDCKNLPLEDHSPRAFVLTQLPYNFNREADCPTWLKAIKQILPDKTERALLQEWFGYCLSSDCRFGKLLLMYGEGANGKGVINCVLREMLGRENTAGVSLEAIDPTRTFLLAQLEGKKANIIEEVNEVTKTAEGILKQLVTGEPITVERKHRDPFEMRNNAKFVISTNTKPRFIDRTDGIWRRILLLPLKQQFLDPEKQDLRLKEPEFWIKSGELPGVFNWALAGLSNLLNRNAFVESEAMHIALKNYRTDSNPVNSFLSENYEASLHGETDAKVCYEHYSQWTKSLGYHPLSGHNFNEEVQRFFPTAKKLPNPVRRDGKRLRVWMGFKLIQ